MKWHAWYSDGSEFTSGRHTTADLPLDGVVLFMLWPFPTNAKRRIMQGTEWYFVAPGDVWDQASGSDYPPGDPAAVRKGIQARYPGARVMRGKAVSAAVYVETQDAAYASRSPA
jgi:hypothetical protein